MEETKPPAFQETPRYDHETLRQEFIKLGDILTDRGLFRGSITGNNHGTTYDYKVGGRGFSIYTENNYVCFTLYDYTERVGPGNVRQFGLTPVYTASYIDTKIVSYSLVDLSQDEIVEQLLLFVLMLK